MNPNMHPKISVVIPAYNVEQYIQDTLNSVLQQTFSDFEVLVVDDASQDGTTQVVRNCADRRVQLISYHPNKGVSAARNLGVARARGDLIAFLDADDLWYPQKLAAHVDHFYANPSLGLSFGRVSYLNGDGSPQGKVAHLRLKQVRPQHLYYENLACTPSNMVMRKATLDQVGGFDGNLKGFEDIEMAVRISCRGWDVEGIDQVLTSYRVNDSGISSQLNRMEYEWHLYNNKVNTYAPHLTQQHGLRANALVLRYLARQSLRLGLPAQVGMDYMRRSLFTDWLILLTQPRRTLLTLLAVYGRYFFPILLKKLS